MKNETDIKQLILPKPKAFLFDMDGVICNTQWAKNESTAIAVNEFFRHQLKIPIPTKEIFEHYNGMRFIDYAPDLFNKYNLKTTEKEIVQIRKRRDEVFNDLIKNQPLAIDDTLEFIRKVSTKGIPLAIASGSKKEFILEIVEKLNIANFFQVIVSSYEVTRGKPYPDVYVEAAKRLSVNAEECYVIEDAEEGMKAGKAASCKIIGLVEDVTKPYSADWLVTSLKQIEVLDY